MENKEICVRCFRPMDDQHHSARNFPADGWHPFRGQSYIDTIEDALLFAREVNQPHKWCATGVIIDVCDSFPEKLCTVCGAINWGGKETGICFGYVLAERAVIAAHNRKSSVPKSETEEPR